MKKFILGMLSLSGVMFSASSFASSGIKAGVEIDAVPYFLGGYYASVGASVDHWQLRYVTTEFETPDFYLQDGFKDNKVDVNAVILDYFLNEDLRGWWIGVGVENWQGKVKDSSSDIEKSYDTNLVTVGGGYTFYLTEHLYLNPWVGVHVPVSGDDKVNFSDRSFDVKTTGEVSVKVGYKF
ncbi:hypothetical protein [Vibrio salinus]|uniref:hypothetical protein n=1 Tax=Vibrio salinus TaxID=2899784 RepID=UPI001E47BA2C|nr:hypothetical protein [Vibrio salinus]MCE0495840.1 hypothetical protein [Vibrio salinus]